MTRIARWSLLALLPLAACNRTADPFASTLPQPMPAAITASAQDQNFMQGMAMSDMFEIQSSRLALQKSHNRAIRAFAQQMIDDHSKTTQQLQALAASKGVTLPGAVTSEQQTMLASLDSARGGFDRAYLRDQVSNHQQALAAMDAELNSGYDTDIRTFVQQVQPTVKTHLDRAQRLAGRS